MSRRFGLAVVAGVSLALLSQGAVKAATALNSGQEIDGWRITFPQGLGVTLNYENSTGPTLNLEKLANFTSVSGLLITFTQVDFNSAASQFAITSEQITNSTNTPFTGFDFALASPLAQGQSFVSTFNQNTFASTTLGSDLVSMTNGSIAPGATAHFGPGYGGGELLINGMPQATGISANFTLKEIPSAGGTPSVPLPAAAWTALTGLLGLGAIGGMKRLRRRHA